MLLRNSYNLKRISGETSNEFQVRSQFAMSLWGSFDTEKLILNLNEKAEYLSLEYSAFLLKMVILNR